MPYCTDMSRMSVQSVHVKGLLMAATKTDRLEMRVDDAFLKRVDDWRRTEPDIPSRSEAIRRLVEFGLASQMDVDANANRLVKKP
jgi:hypothetical protein